MPPRPGQTAPACPQRVVFNGRFLSQAQTGVQRYATETLRAMDAILCERPADFAHLSFELAMHPGAHAPAFRAIRPAPLPGPNSHLWEQWHLWRFAADAYVVNFGYSGPLLKRRQLITLHDATVKVMPDSFKRSYRWVHNALVAVLGRTAQDFMTVSHFSRAEIKRCFGLGRGDVIVGFEGGEHACEQAVSPADDAAVLRRHGLQSGQYIFGAGSVKPNKNFGLVSRALRLLPGYRWPVAVAGAKNIDIFQDNSAVADGFRFLGYVPDSELGALYRHAAWFVLPSLYEGFGLPAVEAMANGCPVLAARAASLPEVCGDAALYFDPHEPNSLAALLREVADKPALRGPVVAAGYQRLAAYNWDANAQTVLARILLRHPGDTWAA